VAGILLRIAGEYFTFGIDRQGFRAGGSNINTEKCHSVRKGKQVEKSASMIRYYVASGKWGARGLQSSNNTVIPAKAGI
jgi:hypothetical protein